MLHRNIYLTVTNALGCISAATSIIINAQPVTPAAPTVGIITQPTCTVATGSVVLSGLPAGNWTINPGGIAGNTATTTISSLAAGTYTYTVTNALGCTSAASANIIINAQPATPTATISGDAIICFGSSANISIALTGNGPWSITYTDGVTPVIVNNIVSTPYVFSVSPAANTTYTLVSVSDATCTGTVSGSASITVTPLVTPNFNAIGPLCQNSSAPSLPSTSLNGFAGTWNPAMINTSTAGINSYVFTPDPGQCAVNTSLNIRVHSYTNRYNSSICMLAIIYRIAGMGTVMITAQVTILQHLQAPRDVIQSLP